MMNSDAGGSGSGSSIGPPTDKNNNELVPGVNFNFDFDRWINELHVDSSGELMMNYGMDLITIIPNYPSQTTSSTINGGSNLGETSSANQYSTQSQGGIFHDIIAASRMSSNNSTATVHRSGQILPDVPQFASNSVAQTSEPRRTTDFPQNQPWLQQGYKNKAVQQPPTHSLLGQSNITFSDQNNQLHYHTPSNQLLPCARPVVNTPTRNLQNNQPRRQTQQNPKQKQSVQQGAGTSSSSVSGGRKTHINFSAPVGFSTPASYPSSLVWREYVLSQIKIMKERFFKEVRSMYHNAVQLHNQAKHVDTAIEYGTVKEYLAKMVAFLSITKIEEIPQNDDRVYNYMNVIVNYMNYHRNKARVSSQNNQPLNSSQAIPNSEANMVNSNQHFPSRKPRPRGRMPVSGRNTSSQMDPKNRNPLHSGSVKAPQAIVCGTAQQINSGANTSSVHKSGSPIGLYSNTMGTNFSSCPLNHQPPAADINLAKGKQPMHKPNEFFLPTSANQMGQQTTSAQWSPLSAPSTTFDVNTLLSPQAIARSPFLLSSTSTQPGGSRLSSLASEKLKGKVDDPPCPQMNQEPQNPKDALSHLIVAANSVSPKSMGSSLTAINSLERLMDYVNPNFAGPYMLYDHEAQLKMDCSLDVSSMYQDQDEFDFDHWDMFLSETSANKKPRIENERTILEEIKEINDKLLETSMHVVSTEDSFMMLGAKEGTIVKCLFKNVCFPELRGSALSEKMPEFVVQLLVPINYPVSSPTIIKSGRDVLSEPWEMLYGETMTRFDLSLREASGQISLGNMARKWDASVRYVLTEFVQKRDEKSFGATYGTWDQNGINSSSGSN